MKKLITLLFLIYCSVPTAISQRVVTISYQQDEKGNVIFSCYNSVFCNYILDFGFTVLKNMKSDHALPIHQEVKPGTTKLLTLSPIDPNAAFQYQFTSGYEKGCINPTVNNNFIYLYPISPGKNAQVYEMSPLRGTDSTSGWYVLRIRMHSGDTIYAARKGIVNEAADEDGSNDSGVPGSSENHIEISHADCSFARYGVLRKNSAMVHPGQLVKAGQPIGLVGGDQFDRGADLRFSVYYYSTDSSNGNQGTKKRVQHYIPMQIWTKNNGKGKLKHGAEYISEFPSAILNQESIPVMEKKKVKKK